MTVVGTSVVVTAYLYDEDGTEIYSKVLEEGTNTGDIEELEYQHTYQFTISSEERIYINETIEIEGSFQVILNSLGFSLSYVEYDVTVVGTSEFVNAYLYGDDGVEVDHDELWEGSNKRGIDFKVAQPSFSFVVKSTSGKVYVSEKLIPPVYFNELKAEGNTIKYSVTITGSEAGVMNISDAGTILPIEIELKAGDITEGVITDLSWHHMVTFHVNIDGEEVYYQQVATDNHFEFIEGPNAIGNVIHYKFIAQGLSNPDIIVNISDDEQRTYEIPYTVDPDNPIIEDDVGDDDPDIVFDWNTEYIIRIYNGSSSPDYIGSVTTDSRAKDVSYTLKGNQIKYEVTIVNADSAIIYFEPYDPEETETESFSLVEGENTGSFTVAVWGITYGVYVIIGTEEEPEETYEFDEITPKRVEGTVEPEGNAIHYDIIAYGEDSIDLCIITPEEEYMWLRGIQVIDGSAAGWIRNDPEAGITIEWCTLYAVYASVGGTEPEFEIGEAEIPERATGYIYQQLDELEYGINVHDPTITTAIMCLWPSSGTQASEITFPVSFRGDETMGSFKFEDKGLAWDSSYEAILYNPDDRSDVIYEFETIEIESVTGGVDYYSDYNKMQYYIIVNRYTSDAKLIVTVENTGVDYVYQLEEGPNSGDFTEICPGSDHIFKVYIDETHTYLIDTIFVPSNG